MSIPFPIKYHCQILNQQHNHHHCCRHGRGHHQWPPANTHEAENSIFPLEMNKKGGIEGGEGFVCTVWETIQIHFQTLPDSAAPSNKYQSIKKEIQSKGNLLWKWNIYGKWHWQIEMWIFYKTVFPCIIYLYKYVFHASRLYSIQLFNQVNSGSML